jgi:hypothetical protein
MPALSPIFLTAAVLCAILGQSHADYTTDEPVEYGVDVVSVLILGLVVV